MWQRISEFVLTHVLFAATLLLAAALGGLVLIAPWLLAREPDSRLCQLFAQDSTVRRTALASAVGLVVTAFVFFRPGLLRSKKPPPKSRRPPPPPPATLAGA